MSSTRRRSSQTLLAAALAALGGQGIALGQNTVSFNFNDAGVTRSVAEWGIDTALNHFDNVRQSVANMGANNVDVVRLTFNPIEPLVDNGNGTYSLNQNNKNDVDFKLGLAALAGSKPISLFPGGFGSVYNEDQWVRTIKATQEYINSKPGWTNTPIVAVEAFNEPDFWQGEGNAAQLNAAITRLKTYPVFQNTQFPAASTLNSNNAASWYNQVPAATQGSSHLLGGSMANYVGFMDHVRNTGKTFVNPELHSLGEAIVGAEHGMVSGTWWGDVLRARGTFVQASDGKRLGYHEDIGRHSAAAVYRAPSGKTYAFAGGIERYGAATSYRFVNGDRDVYFNGIPVREYTLQTKWDEFNAANPPGNDFENYGSWSNQGAYADVETGAGLQPLDGYRWKIVNAQTNQVMEVIGSGTADGDLIRSAIDAGGTNQKWDIVRTRNGYFELFNANSGRTAEVAGGSLNNGASVRQFGTADNSIQQWYIDEAGNGAFYIRNANSHKYLTTSTSNSFQNDNTTILNNFQKWRFVLANPNLPAKAHYTFSNNVNDSGAANHATAFGAPTYGAGPSGFGQAITLNGVTDYVQLPSGVASSKDITVSAYVKWDGGNAWQRIFDFGTGTSSYMFLTPKSGDNTMRFGITTGNGEQMLDTSPLPIGQWVQLTLTLGGNTGVLYVDGKPRVAGQILLDPSHINSTLNYVGKSQFNDPLFDGMIDEFRIFDYALDPGQVASFVFQRWTGEAGANWTAAVQASPKNWQSKLAATDHVNGNAVLFDDYATSFTVNVADTTVTPASTQFDNRNNNYTLGGPGAIAGSGALTKNGAGALTITNANTYTGGTVLNGGTLNLNHANAIGSGTLTIGGFTTLNNTSGAAITLATNNAQAWNGDFAFGGTNALNLGTGAVTMTGNRTVTVNGAAALTIGGAIGESGGARQLTKAGPGTLVLAGATSYTGATFITGGTLSVAGTLNSPGADVWVGQGAGGSGNLNVPSGGAVTANVLLIGAGGSPTAVANGSATLASGGTINTNRWLVIGQSGAVGSSGSLTVNGGTVNVHANAAVSGNLEMGTFDAASATLDVNAGSNVKLLNNASIAFGAQANHSGTATVNHNGGNVTFYSNGGSTVGGAGATILGAAGTGSYTYNLNGGVLTTPQVRRDNGSATATFNFNGGTLRATANQAAFMQGLSVANIQNGGAVLDSNGFSVTVAQPLSGGASTGGLTKNGSGSISLAAPANVYHGPTNVAAGTLVVADTGTRNNVLKGGALTIAPAARLDLKNNKLITTTPVGVASSGVYDGVSGQVQRASNGGAWDEPGLTTSMPDAFGGLTSIGVASGEQVLGLGPSETGNFAGQPITGASTIAMYTYAGDANLDGFISGDDYAAIDLNVAVPDSSGWYNGDFNWDGIISGDDYAAIDLNIVAQGAPFPIAATAGAASALNVTPVPEPASLGVVSLLWFSLARR